MLRPRKKISKHEIREDGLVTVYVKVQKLYQRYARQTHIGLIAILAVAFISIMMVRSKAKAEQSAAGQMGVAEQVYLTGDWDRAITAMTQIMNTYTGTPSAGKAVYLLGNIYLQQGDNENAERYFRLYIQDYGHMSLYKASSMAGIGAAFENRNQYEEAAVWYQKAAEESRESFYSPFYWKDAGRCFAKAGKAEEGRAAYRQIIENYPESQVTQEAEYLLNSL